MYCSLQQSFPLYAYSPRRILARGYPTENLRCFVQSGLREEEEDADNRRVGSEPDVILVERYGNGTSKRYLLRDDSPLQAFLEEHDNEDHKLEGSASVDAELPWLPVVVKDFILPAGFPGSVSEDYLEYMLLQFPTNVTGWICHAIVTSSLLKAVGVGTFSGTSAAASAAAIRWVSKDGIGAVGRFLIGGRFGNLFDDDPKQWRMYADFIGSAGSIFDLSTQLFPSYFLPLASMGSLTKAIARALRDPSFRVIQNHFAISRNLGEVAAKEEVWEVAAQLIGLGLGIVILDTPGFVKSIPVLSLTWMSVRFLHLYLRYLSLSVLRFDTINLKRARILVHSHVTRCLVPGCTDGNKQENILLWEKFMKPQIVFAAPLEEMIGQHRSVSMVRTFLRIYRNEKYILAANGRQKDFKVFISYKVGATGESVLRSLWQTYWLHNNMRSSDNECGFNELKKSLVEMETKFEDFILQLEKSGWNVNETNLKIPTEILIDEQIQA